MVSYLPMMVIWDSKAQVLILIVVEDGLVQISVKGGGNLVIRS